MKKVLFAIVMALVATTQINAHKLTINLKGVDNEKGQIGIAIFTEENFMDYNKVAWAKMIAPMTGTVSVDCELPEGKYAIMVMHDENKNYTVDLQPETGIPTEATGMSNNPVLKGFPTFDQVGFTLDSDQSIDIQMVRYVKL